VIALLLFGVAIVCVIAWEMWMWRARHKKRDANAYPRHLWLKQEEERKHK
jgi:uncharacterized iron-regulated membrane protein